MFSQLVLVVNKTNFAVSGKLHEWRSVCGVGLFVYKTFIKKTPNNTSSGFSSFSVVLPFAVKGRCPH